MDPSPFGFPNTLQKFISSSTGLAAYLDRKLLVLLLDGRIVIGTICSFETNNDSSLPELPPFMTKASLPEILTAKKAEEGSSLLKRNLKKWMEEFLG